MHTIFGLFLFIIAALLILFFGLLIIAPTVLWTLLRAYFKSKNKENRNASQQQQYTNSERKQYGNGETSYHSTARNKQGGKMFEKNEGEYIDFEEIK